MKDLEIAIDAEMFRQLVAGNIVAYKGDDEQVIVVAVRDVSFEQMRMAIDQAEALR